MNRRLYCLLVVLEFSSLRLLGSFNSMEWVTTYLYNTQDSGTANNHELEVILNLLYISFARSITTLEAQEDGLHALETSWQAYQNIIQLRRDPSKKSPYLVDQETFTIRTKTLFERQTTHNHIGKVYATAIEQIVHGSVIQNSYIHKGIQKIRSHARKLIINTLAHVKDYLDTILDKKSTLPNSIDPDNFNVMNKNFNIGDYIGTLIPHIALNSFIKTDDLTIFTSENWWHALHQMLTISNVIWKSIEGTRAKLYLDLYKTAYSEAERHGAPVKTMNIIFGEYGLLDIKNRTAFLPEPTTLHIPY